MSKMKFLLTLIFFGLIACNRFNHKKLIFINKSSSRIDSIVLRENERINLGPLDTGQQYSKEYSDLKINTGHEGLFEFKVFLNGKKFSGTWGFHDYGILDSITETFYIFDHGIARKGEPLKKPEEFRLFFGNASSEKIDSIVSDNKAIIKINELTPRSIEIVYNYSKIESSKNIIIIMSGRRLSRKLDFHDFDNWNNNQDFLHYDSAGLHTDVAEWREPLEFLVDLEIKINLPADSVFVSSGAIVKSYNYKQPNYKRMVFDFKKLKQNPVFQIQAGDKIYKVDLSSHDFSNIYDHQKIYYLEKNGIKSLTD